MEVGALMARPLIISGDTARVPVKLPGGGLTFAVIDAADAYLVDDRNWFAKVRAHTTYAHDRAGSPMHLRLFPLADEVDHRDHDGLNNRRSNLRPLTGKKTRCLQNANTRGHKDSTTGFKGVRRNRDRFEARITLNGRRRSLGHFDRAEDAARAYDKAAARHFPGVAFLNFAPANDIHPDHGKDVDPVPCVDRNRS